MKDCCACKLESRNDPLGEAGDFKSPGAGRTPPDQGHSTVSVGIWSWFPGVVSMCPWLYCLLFLGRNASSILGRVWMANVLLPIWNEIQPELYGQAGRRKQASSVKSGFLTYIILVGSLYWEIITMHYRVGLMLRVSIMVGR